jgi:UDP-N-acetylmuramoyl-tripeptide--D-alanyl-D-alanine ligase
VQLTLSGEHQVATALAATAFALAAGIGLADIVAVLETYESPSKWRMEVTERPDGVTVINDAYNANPESMRAALKALVAMGRGADQRRTWAVIGEMRELGDISIEEHDSIGRLVVRLDVSKLVAVGEGARPVHLGAAHEGSWGEESTWVPDVDSAIALLRDQVQPGDIVLVKASRSIGLEKVAEALLESTTDAGSAP